MQILHSNGIESDDGFIYVASRNRLFYELALISGQSLKDFSRKTHITLFTHKNFVDDRCKKIFDKVITDIPIHYRAKMWCMARTPYKRTIYNDVDSVIQHRDVTKMFDFMNDCDLFCGSNPVYTVGNIKVAYIDIKRQHRPLYHGSMWGYNNTELNLDLMQTWFDKYVEQVTTPWKDSHLFYKDWQMFDMFTIWKLTSKRFKEYERFNNLKIKILSRRWNNTIHDIQSELDGPPVITQISRSEYRRMTTLWNTIQRGAKDESYSVKKREINDPIIEFN